MQSSSDDEHKSAEKEGPSEPQHREGRDELRVGQQGTSSRAGNRDHEEEERDAHRTGPELGGAGPPPKETRRDKRHYYQQDRLQDELLERRGLTLERQGDRGHEVEAEYVQTVRGDQGPSGVPYEDRGDRRDCSWW